jgi:hypothetical protein
MATECDDRLARCAAHCRIDVTSGLCCVCVCVCVFGRGIIPPLASFLAFFLLFALLRRSWNGLISGCVIVFFFVLFLVFPFPHRSSLNSISRSERVRCIYIYIYIYIHTYIYIYIYSCCCCTFRVDSWQIDRRDRHTDRQTARQTDRETDRHVSRHSIWICISQSLCRYYRFIHIYL